MIMRETTTKRERSAKGFSRNETECKTPTQNVLWRRKPPKEIKDKERKMTRTFGAASTCDHIETTPSLFVIALVVVTPLFPSRCV
jgi:hypothetical protein|tara:strand:- start:379 stop:633 length:255 start_codon:yes stop_codon:yes gene_type:complete